MFGTHRLHQKADATGLSASAENSSGQRKTPRPAAIPARTAGGNLQAIEARHADIEQHTSGLRLSISANASSPVGGAGLQDCITLELADHSAQALAGLGFVINDQDIHIALDSCVSLAQG
jgi:hypothetical protein